MNFSSIPILAVALALMISWGLFAICCSLIQEALAQLTASRGRFMKKYLFQQLQDAPNGVNWASLLYLHGTIDLLSRAPNKPTNDIEPRLFAQTLVEVVGSAQLVQMRSDPEQIPYKKDSLLFNFKKATQVLAASDEVALFKQALNNAELTPAVGGMLDEGLIYQNLVAGIAGWYTELTQRLTLWYKKKIRRSLFIIGVLIGLILNVDSIQLFKTFNADPSSRNALIAYYEKNGAALSAMAHQIDSQEVKKASPAFQDFVREGGKFEKTLDSLKRAAVLPIGFQESVFVKKNPDEPLPLRLLGILVSGFAASFGAPFWFDLLKKLFSKNP